MSFTKQWDMKVQIAFNISSADSLMDNLTYGINLEEKLWWRQRHDFEFVSMLPDYVKHQPAIMKQFHQTLVYVYQICENSTIDANHIACCDRSGCNAVVNQFENKEILQALRHSFEEALVFYDVDDNVKWIVVLIDWLKHRTEADKLQWTKFLTVVHLPDYHTGGQPIPTNCGSHRRKEWDLWTVYQPIHEPLTIHLYPAVCSNNTHENHRVDMKGLRESKTIIEWSNDDPHNLHSTRTSAPFNFLDIKVNIIQENVRISTSLCPQRPDKNFMYFDCMKTWNLITLTDGTFFINSIERNYVMLWGVHQVRNDQQTILVQIGSGLGKRFYRRYEMQQLIGNVTDKLLINDND